MVWLNLNDNVNNYKLYQLLYNTMKEKLNVNWKILIRNIDLFVTNNNNPDAEKYKKICVFIKAIIFNNYITFGVNLNLINFNDDEISDLENSKIQLIKYKN